MRIIIAFTLIAFAMAHPMKRQAQNSYGDEAASVPAAAAPEQSFAAEPAQPSETAPEPVAQEEAAPEAASQDAGYRSKRQAQNSYGDEAAAAPAPAAEEPAPAAEEPAPVEQAAEPVAQEEAAPEAASQDAGYRVRRDAQNSYGDEAAAAPAPAAEEPAPAAEEPAPVEQAAEPVAQEEAAPEAASQDAGYRVRRDAQNSYGDEAAAAPAAEEPAPAAEESAPVEQAAEPVAQEEAAPEAASQDAGYRVRRDAQNSYGDEAAAAPAPAAEEPAPAAEEPAPVEQAAEPVAQEEAAPEAASQDAGYRVRRDAQNSYGDEAAAAPAPAAEEPAPAAEEPAPVEQAAEPVAQEEAAPEAASQDAGYRVRRDAQNSYGDEAAAAPAPAAEEPAPAAEEPAPVEQAAEPVAQEEAAPEAASQDAGYRV